MFLGEGPDDYRPQQSIRTFTNVSRPGELDVKVSLSILNTMVYRGIPTELARVAPSRPRGSTESATTTRSCATSAG